VSDELSTQGGLEGIAVIGMSGCFPGARDLDEFWRNLRDGTESISFFTREELEAEGVPAALLDAPEYVPAGGVLDDMELFDAAFFGFSPREAELMDPQYRFFMTHAWQALEAAGYDTERYAGAVGIFGGMNISKYLILNLLPNEELVASEGALQLRILNDKDFLASLAAYKMNLRGPSLTVQTACSTSLVAVSLACQSLLNYQCDIALAGGVSVSPRGGYLPQEGVFSADGHCRAFDAHAGGTVGGDGVGIVALKRLADAVADRDHIHAVIRGSAVNNDGALKVGYTAPSVDGQAEVIAMAQALAGVEPETITYVETHGTATPMGDPIEIAALTQVFRAGTDRKQFCAVGSVKTNIGHLDAAAGVASLLKTVLAMKERLLPPSLHFTAPNPQIDFANSPFYVNSRLTEWKSDGGPRRAGVSAFAVGGVNAHVILEEAPEAEPSEEAAGAQLLVLSAKTATALEKATDNLREALGRPGVNLADVAYTLQVGRAAFAHRRALVCAGAEEAAAALESRDPKRLLTGHAAGSRGPVTFMFPGLGNHYVGMAGGLYETEPYFREEFDRCCELLRPHLGLDLREVVHPAGRADGEARGAGLDLRRMLDPRAGEDEAARRLNRTGLTQPALFVVEYALARLWMKWGVSPQAMIGYSLGEYVAACLAGVFSLEDALMLVARRAQMIEELPAGAMLAVPLSEKEAQPLLGGGLSLAAVNGPSLCVIAGPPEEVAGAEQTLRKAGLACRQLLTSHAFHSGMMDPVAEPFTRLLERVELKAPSVPFVSNVTGTWITAAQATDPAYWAGHMRRPVRFAEGVAELLRTPGPTLLEVGPGQVLGAWALQHPANGAETGLQVLASLRHSYDPQPDRDFILQALGRLWLAGVEVSWEETHGEARRRVPLPTYPFEPQRYWITPRRQTREGSRLLQAPLQPSPEKRPDPGEWFYAPVWKQEPPAARDDPAAEGPRRWLLFADEVGVGSRVAERLGREGHEVFTVTRGAGFERRGERDFALDPASAADYAALLAELRDAGRTPQAIVHLWSVTHRGEGESAFEFAGRCQAAGFDSLLRLAQAIGNEGQSAPLHLVVVSNNAHEVTGDEELHAEKATLFGPCRVIPQEYPNVTCRGVDVDLRPGDAAGLERAAASLAGELALPPANGLLALRGRHRWAQTFEPMRLEKPGAARTRVRRRGVYLITGGLGGVGLTLAEHLAESAQARLVLTGRTPFPPREEWEARLGAGDEAGEPDGVGRLVRRLLALEQMGAEVLVLSADVTSREQMAAAFDAARARFGHLDGVVHAAGVSPGGLMQVKTPEAADAVLAPKVRGTLVLDELLGDARPDFFVLCSSLAALTGGLGMVDHCAANSFLDAFARRRSADAGGLTLSLNWDTWLEVGQAANAPVSAGLKDLLHTSAAGATSHPLLDGCLVEDEDRRIYLTRLSTARHWMVNEHRIGGRGIFPGTAYLELVRAAFAEGAPNRPVTLRKVLFVSPLTVRDGEEKEVRTIIERDGDRHRFMVVSRPHDAADEWQEHVRGEVAASTATPGRRSIKDLVGRCREREVNFDAPAGNGRPAAGADGDAGLYFGPRWHHLLKRLHAGGDEALALLELSDEFAPDLEHYPVHPALMDAATGFVQLVGEGVYLPLAYESVRIGAPLKGRVYSYLRRKAAGPAGAGTITCDVLIMDEDGNELVEVEDYTLRRVGDVAALAAAQGAAAADADAPERAAVRQEVPQSADDGILPREGAEVFARALSLAHGHPQLAVCTRDLRALLARAQTFNRARVLEEMEKLQSHRQKHPRPNVQTPYVGPRSELERSLAHIWQATLGLEQVGVYDNFFDVGGDSLLATQLIARLAKNFDVDLPLRAVFETPTVAELAVRLTQQQAAHVEDEEMARLLAELEAEGEGQAAGAGAD